MVFWTEARVTHSPFTSINQIPVSNTCNCCKNMRLDKNTPRNPLRHPQNSKAFTFDMANEAGYVANFPTSKSWIQFNVAQPRNFLSINCTATFCYDFKVTLPLVLIIHPRTKVELLKHFSLCRQKTTRCIWKHVVLIMMRTLLFGQICPDEKDDELSIWRLNRLYSILTAC